jgi:putative tryptophan/tyrosine transport system substrate-binding protein
VITRRHASLASCLGLVLAHGAGVGQRAAALRRVGYLGVTSMATGGQLVDAFKQGMRDLGWVEGINIEYRMVYAEGEVSGLDALARALLSQQVEVIAVGSAQAARAAQKATKTVPIVMTGVGNAVDSGFVTSLASPGGNVTGVSAQSEEVLGKLVEILHGVVPKARRISFLLNEGNPTYSVLWASAQAACAKLGLVALPVAANSVAEFSAAAQQILGNRSQAVVVVGDATFFAERDRLLNRMQTTRLPVAYMWRELVVAGGLLSYAVDLADSFRYSAKWVDKILKGAKPANLPVEQPTKFELVINLKTAKAMGLTIPQSLLLRADEVIE